MPKSVYALLVAIDTYQPPVRPLRGCCNDIDALDAFLCSRLVNEHYVPRILKNETATRQALIDGFRQHLAQAGPDDVALFAYSGHGSQADSPPEFWHGEPDKRDETLVCYDSRVQGRWDLTDNELATLIAELAARNCHIVVILDCCHSGSGTRSLDDPDLDVRTAPPDDRPRPLSSFLVAPDEVAATRGDTSAQSNWVDAPHGRHIVLSACRADEEAKEYRDGERRRGAFSYFLLETLQHTSGSLSYRDLHARTSAGVLNSVTTQTPQIEAATSADLDQPFLGGTAAVRVPYWTCSYDPVLGWVINGGAVHGVQAPNGDDCTKLAVFPFDATADQLRDMRAAIGEAQVIAVRPERSQIAISNIELDPTTTYKAIVLSIPVAPIFVQFNGDEDGIARLRQAVAGSGNGEGASVYVREAGAAEAATLQVVAQNATYNFMQLPDQTLLAASLEGYTDEAAQQAIGRLEHMARWLTLAELANPTTRISAVACELYRITGPATTRDPLSAPIERIVGTNIQLTYTERDCAWLPPQMRIRLHNTGAEPLYCMLLDLEQQWAIRSDLLAGGGVWLQPGEEIWAPTDGIWTVEVIDDALRPSTIPYRNVLKLIVTTAQCDATLLDQGPLDVPPQSLATRSTPGNTLEHLMQRVLTREGDAVPSDTNVIADWTTQRIDITTFRPLPQ